MFLISVLGLGFILRGKTTAAKKKKKNAVNQICLPAVRFYTFKIYEQDVITESVGSKQQFGLGYVLLSCIQIVWYK